MVTRQQLKTSRQSVAVIEKKRQEALKALDFTRARVLRAKRDEMVKELTERKDDYLSGGRCDHEDR